jgi:hypothetical protein
MYQCGSSVPRIVGRTAPVKTRNQLRTAIASERSPFWEEQELKFGGRSHEELDFYAEHGFWPEQRGQLYYSMQDGKLFVEWRNTPEEEGIGLETTSQSKERDHQIQVGGTNDSAKEE